MRSRTKSRAAAGVDRPRRWALFDQPPLLPGEDAGDYDALVEQIRLVVKPADVIEEMLIADRRDGRERRSSKSCTARGRSSD